MNKVKIVHCADLHLDSAFGGMPDKAAIRRDELRETFNKIINITLQENAQLLLISGDLFDSGNVSPETIAFLKAAFNEIPHVEIFISPGNHDPMHQDSCYITEAWPDNVHIFGNAIDCITLPELNARVYGSGFTMPYMAENKLSEFDSVSGCDNYINIMVMHGDVLSPGGQSSYNPINPDSISKSGLDYIALGHKHDFSGILKAGDTYYAYSGIPEGRGFDELGPKGIITGFVSKGYVDLAFVGTSKRVYHEIMVDISDCNTYDSICDTILDKCGKKASDNLNLDIFRVILTGAMDNNFSPDLSVISSRLRNKFFYIKIKNQLSIKFDLEVLMRENSLKGIFVRKFYERIEAARKNSDYSRAKRLETALMLGLKAFEGEVDLIDY